jgi:hypothetical protein
MVKLAEIWTAGQWLPDAPKVKPVEVNGKSPVRPGRNEFRLVIGT